MKYCFQSFFLVSILSFLIVNFAIGQSDRPMDSHIGFKLGFIDSPWLGEFQGSLPAFSLHAEIALTDENLWDDKFSVDADLTYGKHTYEEGLYGRVTLRTLSATAGANLYPLNLLKKEKESDAKFRIMPRVGIVMGYDYSLINNSEVALPVPRRFFVGAKAGLKIGISRFAVFADVGYMPQSIIQIGMGYTIPTHL